MSSQLNASTLSSHHEQFIKAAKLYNFVNLTTKHVIPNFQFEVRHAMVDAGIPDALAASPAFTNKFNEYLYAEMNQNRFQNFDLPITEQILVTNMKKILQILHPHIPSEAMHLFVLAGFNVKVKKRDDGSTDRKDYDRVVKKLRRALNAFKDSNPSAPAPPAPDHIHIPSNTTPASSNSTSTPIPVALNGRTIELPPPSDEFSQTPMSPLTTSQRTSVGDSSTLSTMTGAQRSQASRSCSTNTTISTIRVQRQRGNASTIHDSSNSTSTVDIFGDPIPRQTSTQAQKSRQYIEKEKKTRALGFKIGTTLYNEKLKGNNEVKHLQTVDEIADGINRLLGIEVICGNEIKKAVAQNRIGVGPAQLGRPTELPSDEIEDLAILFFSISSIEQANAGKRLKRPQLVSLLDQIVNEKRRREGKKELNSTHLYKHHIEPLNSLRQDVNPVDRREFIRVLWLTYRNLSENYARWEDACIQEGFARYAETEEELQEHGKMVFFGGKYSNLFMNFDEMQLSLDQNSERPGGRPADMPTNPSISDPGEGQHKSGAYCTIVASIIGNEPGIPLFIFPTQAKSGHVNVHAKRFESFPQIQAKYGNPFARWYDVNIQYSTKGSMTSSIISHWVQGFSEYYPNVADEKGKRVMVKSDFGPGRLRNEGFMSNLLIDGFKFFASLPNGTEITQEMDQLFSEFKRLCYLNREQLFTEMVFVSGPKAKLTVDHIGYIVFGGEVKIAPNHSVNLTYKPFIEAFTEEKIMSARDGCGFWPYTRNALKSKKVRHVLRSYRQSVSRSSSNTGNDNSIDRSDSSSDSSSIADDDDGTNVNSSNNEVNTSKEDDNNDDCDVQEELLQSIEDLNIKTVTTLVAKGYYNVAELGARKLLRESGHSDANGEDNEEINQQSHIIRTEPHTKERQDQLASAKYAGEFHRITMGGGILNCPDMMIGLARKRMKKDAEDFEKKKKLIQVYEKISEQAMSSVFSKPYARWTAKDTKIAIKYKQGLKAPDDRKWNQNAKLSELKTFYEQHYKGRAVLDNANKICWKPEDEAKLLRMKAGEIGSVQETTMYARALEGRKDYLVKRLNNLTSESRFQIIEDVVVQLNHEERQILGCKLGLIMPPSNSDSESESGDSNTSQSIVIAATPIPLLLTEILDDQQVLSQSVSSEEDMVDKVNNDYDTDNSKVVNDDESSAQSSDICLESLMMNQRDNNHHGGGSDNESESSSCFDFQQKQYAHPTTTAPISTNSFPIENIIVNEGSKEQGAIDDVNTLSCSNDREKNSAYDDVAQTVSENVDKETVEAVEGSMEDVDSLSFDNRNGHRRNKNKAFTPSVNDHSNVNEDNSRCSVGEEESGVWIKLSQITLDKNGIALIKDELDNRGIKYDDKWKIRKLKSVLSNEGLDGEKEFEPKSSLILQAIKDESI